MLDFRFFSRERHKRGQDTLVGNAVPRQKEQLMRPNRTIAGVAVAAGTLIASFTGTAAAHAAGSSYQGCPSGAVCIYPQNAGFNGGHPESNGVFFSYAGHNLSSQYGAHVLVNNQYGNPNAAFGLCASYGGKGGFANTTGTVAEGGGNSVWYGTVELSPVNSVDLRPYSQYNSLCKR